jgi:2'-5' RNA ligase
MTAVRPRRMFGEKEPDTPVEEHKFSSTQVQITGPVAKKMEKLALAVPDNDLFREKGAEYGGKTANDGREHEPHITVKFGIEFHTPSKRLRAALAAFGPITAKLGETSLFTGEDADVLKIDVDSPDLHRLNALVKRLSPTHDTFPNYHPHATLCYCIKGTGHKYAGDKTLAGTTLRFTSVTFSGKRGHREVLPLTGSPAPLYRAY